MAFWDGTERNDKTWKALRLELAGALEVGVDDPVWQVALVACGELAPAVAIAASFAAAGPAAAVAQAPSCPESPGVQEGTGDVESAVRYFCGLPFWRETASLRTLSENFAPAERAALVNANSCSVADCAAVAPAS
jgi:hypothetical protein